MAIFVKFERLRQPTYTSDEETAWDPKDSRFVYVSVERVDFFEPQSANESHSFLHIRGEELAVEEAPDQVAKLLDVTVRDKPPGKGAHAW